MAGEGTDQGAASDADGAASPKNTTSATRAPAGQSLGLADKRSLESRADPDAQTTVTDFLDFTEYLPSDLIRSLTLIGKLDETYADASVKVDELTTTWGQLPSLPAEERPSAVSLRADISEKLGEAMSSRVFAHDEAVRMSVNVNRHYHKAKLLLSKLREMLQNYPSEEPRSPVVSKSPQVVRAKPAVGGDGQKIRRHRIPKVTVPGEVLAPYEIEYDTGSDDSDISTDEESDTYAVGRRMPAGPRIKLVSSKVHKGHNRLSRPVTYSSAALSAAAAVNAAALLNPPPENAVIGSADAPWLQLTNYELAKLRKRMKKNATWTPSETMVARELKALGRGPDEYREAKQLAERDGKQFNPKVPSLVVDDESGIQHLPAGAISAEAIGGEEVPTSNRGMKLNEAKKLKREALAKQAAEDAEESARKMAHAAKLIMGSKDDQADASKDDATSPEKASTTTTSRSTGKRKRDGESEDDASDSGASPPAPAPVPVHPPPKRSKLETPVPPPHHPGMSQSGQESGSAGSIAPNVSRSNNNISSTTSTNIGTNSSTIVNANSGSNVKSNASSNHLQPTSAGSIFVTQPQTPVPIPLPPQSSTTPSASSPGLYSALGPPSVSNGGSITTTIPVRPPAETPVPLPRTDRTKSITPVAPPPAREPAKRETRGEAAKRTRNQSPPDTALTLRPPSSRGHTPNATTPAPPETGRRPGSRGGKAASQEPPSLASDRPRRTSTARTTPGPEFRQPPPKRMKRPAPGVVSTTNSGGSSAVGKRKAAPRRKARATKREKGQGLETEMEEVDDEGNPIDPEEPRYCLCNRVSFGTMIQCDNIDNCKQEWFHLECVGLEDIPARTTKWYCPDCRKVLNIGERGEVNARGVRK
ncbi:PHD finger domain-containing protein [Moelleriella libera RCEF 2490]|uniref:PHD finger domain-containing protein n=1 Tax=Moelleriella libera RCEF 2490 TaxID=1081109 RepID=A0A168BYK9_9HYPO|nr:PHD finger domain-containing protein [Moelleriella libera RCEF 2490]